MKEALIMCVVLFALFIYRRILQVPAIQAFLHRDIAVSAVWFQYYTLLMVCLVALLVHSLAVMLLRMRALFHGPEDVARALAAELARSPELDAAEAKTWEHELRIDHWLLNISVFAPPAVIVTFVVVFSHVVHLVRDHDVNSLAWFPSQKQDWVLQVILLPAMYAAMALRSVIRSWEVMLGCGCPAGLKWSEFVATEIDMYNANFAVANFAEMYTLWCFGRLCLDLLKRTFKSRENFVVFSAITMQGVDGFIICGLLKVMSQIALGFIGHSIREAHDAPLFANWNIRIEHLQIADNFLKVLMVIASGQCLFNMMMVCWMSGLRDINPSLKFMGTRALIMFSQWQSFFLDFLGHYSASYPYGPQQVRLLQASLLCYECLMVSLLHVISWPAEDFEAGYLPLEDDHHSWKDMSRASTFARSATRGIRGFASKQRISSSSAS